jgi:hypothetical protein
MIPRHRPRDMPERAAADRALSAKHLGDMEMTDDDRE